MLPRSSLLAMALLLALGCTTATAAAVPCAGGDGFPCSYSKQDCCPNNSCQLAGPPAKVGDKGICRSDSPPSPPVCPHCDLSSPPREVLK
eukprot:gene24145-5342_t